MFSNAMPDRVASMSHDRGTEFSFDESVFTEWKWQEMVAQLDDDSMRVVVNGQINFSRGLVGCSLQQSGIHDQKRHHAQRQLGIRKFATLYEWYFVLERDDGSSVALHPNHKNTKVTSKVFLTLKFDASKRVTRVN